MLLKSSFSATMHNHIQVLKCRKQSQNLDGLLFSHPPYNPEFAPSDLSLFGVLKDATLGRFGSKDKVIQKAKKWLQVQNPTWYKKEIYALVSHWHKALEVDEDYVQK